MENFFNEQEIQKMLQTEILYSGKKLDGLTVPISCFKDSNQLAYLYDSDTLNLLGANKAGLAFYGIGSSEELEKKGVSFLEKKKQEQHKDTEIFFASKAEADLSETLSTERATMFTPFDNMTNVDGYCIVNANMRTPVYKNNKLQAVLSLNWDITKSESIEKLYNHYKCIYVDNMKKGNRLFMEYIGLPTIDGFMLTTRQIEVLIGLAKHRTSINVSRSLDLSEGTISAYIADIKHRLHNQNLDDILLHFTTNDRRKF